MDELNQIELEIERTRERLHQLVIVKQNDTTHPEVAELSATLDKMIVQFQHLKSMRKVQRGY